jgi:RND superfamily putative drug exporter
MPAITRFVLRRKLLVTMMWLVLAVAGALAASGTTKRLSSTFETPGPAATTDKQVVTKYHIGVQDPIVPVLTAPAGQSPKSVGDVFAAAKKAVPNARVVDYANTKDKAFITSDGRSTYALITAPGGVPSVASASRSAIERAVKTAAPPGWKVQITGIDALSNGSTNSKGNGVLVESMLGAVGALIVLIYVFASFLALLPLVVAGVSILTTFLALDGLTRLTSVSMIVEFLVALIGLGVAIDYSLLVVTRWREERAHGKDNISAVEAAMASAGRAVLFSGLTVGIGLLSLVVLPVPFLRSAGIGGVLIPVISVAVAVTLLPILLATVGPKLDWPRIRTDNKASRAWTRWAGMTFRRRGIAAVAGIVTLGVLTIPAFGLHVGEPRTSALARSGPAYVALQTLEHGGVHSGALTPIVVLTKDSAANTVVDKLSALPGIDTAVAPDRAGGTALVTVLPSAETNIGAGQDTVRAVRNSVKDMPGVIGVDGSGASAIDFSNKVYGSFPLLLGLIALATFILLARAFRSILLPAKAVLLNLASLAAAYGVVVFIWQHGHGSEAIWGVPSSGVITMWVPLMVFAFLFGLSMDYEVFILARMREEYDSTGSTESAVVQGIGRTGRLVTSAALILVLSFLAMSTAPQTDVKILATGLGAGILVDATVVRCLLVPALVSLFGRYNWWLPTWAARILRVEPSPLRPVKQEEQPQLAGVR